MQLYNSDSLIVELSGILMTLISFFVIAFYFSHILTPKKESKFYILKYFLMLTINYFIARTVPVLYENRDLIINGTILVMPFIFSKDKLWKKLLISISWMVFNLLINAILNLMMMEKFNLTFNDFDTMSYEEIINITKGNGIYLTQALSYTLLSFIEICILLIKNRKELKTKEIFLIDLLAVLLVVISTVPAYFYMDNQSNVLILISVVSFSISVLLMIYSYSRIKFYQFHYKSVIENKFLKQKEQMQLDYYKIMNDKEENIRKINHDIKNNLQVIYTLKSKEDKEKLVEKIMDNLKKYELVKYSSNDILNIVLNTKVNEARNKDIDIKIELKKQIDFIEDLDISNLFSNILDNAIENADKTKDKRIDLKVNKKLNYVVIKCINTYDGVIKKKDKSIMTTKKDDNHGYGLKIIKDIIKKYNGEINLEYDENEFTINILLPEKSK